MSEGKRPSSVRSVPVEEPSFSQLETAETEEDDAYILSDGPSRQDSGGRRQEEGGIEEQDHAPRSRSKPRMPDLKSRRFTTERPPPLSKRATLGLSRRATGGEYLRAPLAEMGDGEDARSSTPSSDSQSIRDEKPDMRNWAMPTHNQAHMAQLNRTERPDQQHHAGGREHSHEHSDGDERGDAQSIKNDPNDGRLSISINEILGFTHLARALGLKHHHRQAPQPKSSAAVKPAKPKPKPPVTVSKAGIPRMNIVIMVIGSRGDIQPFLKIGKILKEKHGHRVRIATHPVFRDFVQRDSGLEFFSVGGDPSELMSFMVKNPGLIPSLETLRAGEIGRRRDSMYEMFQGFWHACVNAIDDEKDAANLAMMGERYPFIADAIIANPPSFAHIHCAERLGIPLHLVFTFPYTPTQHFPHPLANITADEEDPSYINLMSYPLVDLMTWQGLGDLVNHFRVKTLGLQPMSTLWAPGQLFRLRVPHTYLWSPGLVPKPTDWGPEIDVAGYVFLDLASSYEPPEEMTKFLNAGEAPIYIGFGSISGVKDPDAFTKMVFGAVEKVGVRAIISKGWGDMGKGMDIPDNVLLIDSVPHDWLFPRVQAVVHHGGAGTTAIGLKCGKPTMIVPFFGDQPFWGAMIARARAGAEHCLPLSKLDVDKFTTGIRQCLTPEARQNAEKIAQRIREEGDGADNMVDSFHRKLPLDGENSLRCFIFPTRVAVWKYRRTRLCLSALAADLLVEKGCLQWRDLRLLRHYDWNDFQGPGEPITGAGAVFFSDIRDMLSGVSSIAYRTKRGLRLRDKQRRRRQRRTVGNAVTLPGQFAQERVRLSMSPEERAEQGHRAGGFHQTRPSIDEVNLQGAAAPPAGRWRHVIVRSPTFELLQLQEGIGDQAGSFNKDNPKVNGHLLPSKEPHQEQHQNHDQHQQRLIRPTEETSKLPSAPSIAIRATMRGVGHSTKVLIRMPVDLCYALTLGSHNAPRLYGDSSVRTPPCPITGFRSGLHAAGVEFVYGISDGVCGLVRLPRRGMEFGDRMGFASGLGKGLGGLVLKPTAGVVGLAGFTGKGVEVGVRNHIRDTGKTDRWLTRAQIHQGEKDLKKLKDEVREGSDGSHNDDGGNDSTQTNYDQMNSANDANDLDEEDVTNDNPDVERSNQDINEACSPKLNPLAAATRRALHIWSIHQEYEARLVAEDKERKKASRSARMTIRKERKERKAAGRRREKEGGEGRKCEKKKEEEEKRRQSEEEEGKEKEKEKEEKEKEKEKDDEKKEKPKERT